MNSRFTLKKNGKVVAKNVVNLSLNNNSYKEQHKVFDYSVLNGEEKIISFEGIQLFFGELTTNGLVEFEFKFDKPFVLLSFEINGGHGFKLNDNTKILELENGTCNCSYLPKFEGSMYYTCEQRKYITCIFSKQFITTLLNFHFPKVGKQYIDMIVQNQQFNIFEKSKKIPFAVHHILNEIINSYHKGEIQEAYLKTKITEIFIELFSEFNDTSTQNLSENEILAEKTREVIQKQFASKITLDDIAKELTTNKTKLKTVFKERFDTTIFAYKTSIQMEEAKKLIISNNYTIAEVAYLIGYKNPQHFTTAFKKHFNLAPSHYLQRSIS